MSTPAGALSNEDLAALYETSQQLAKSGDPRGAKIQQFIQQQGHAQLDDKRGMFKKAWDWMNQGFISKDTFVRAMSGMTPQQLDDALQSYSGAGETPAHAAVREFVRGSIQDTAQTASSFTSPLAVTTMAAGPATKVPGALGKIARVATTAGSVGFGAQGANQVVQAGTENTPEAWQQRLQGMGMVAGASAGAYAGGKQIVTGDIPSPRGIMADRMAEKPAGSEFTRQQVVDAAKANNVNLDLAQATDSGILQGAKRANRYSLASQGTYDAAQTKNVNALEQWANSEASKYSPTSADREVVGPQIQKALQEHLQVRQNAAAALFNDLDTNFGNTKPNATNVYDTAKRIVAENADYFDKNPALKQSRAWQIVNDLADRAETTKASGRLNESGQPIQGAQTKPDTWTDLQKLRTDLMNETRSPDIIGSRAEGWLKQLTGEVDNAMTGAGSGLKGADLAKFRQANSIWESIKSTYDNPQSPYYHAVRAQFPSQVPGMLTKGTPELAASVRQTLGSLEGPFQRQFVEQILNDKSGQLDLKNLNSRLGRIPTDFLESMLGEEGARNLKLLGKVAAKVTADANPSGTAKVGVPAAEVTGLFHNPVAGGLELGAQYGGAKIMNSPTLLDYLTKR